MGRMATYTGKTSGWEQAMASKWGPSPKGYGWDADPPILPEKHGNYPLTVPGITRFI